MTGKEQIEICMGAAGAILMKSSPMIPTWLEKMGEMSSALNEVIGTIAGIAGLVLLYHSITYHIIKKQKIKDGEKPKS